MYFLKFSGIFTPAGQGKQYPQPVQPTANFSSKIIYNFLFALVNVNNKNDVLNEILNELIIK